MNPACNRLLIIVYKGPNMHFYAFLEMNEFVQNMVDVATVYNSVHIATQLASYCTTCNFTANM